jgi:hypothetical protein
VIYTIIARNGSKFHENPVKNTAETAADTRLQPDLFRSRLDNMFINSVTYQARDAGGIGVSQSGV